MNPNQIIQTVTDYFNEPLEDVLRKGRYQEAVKVRQVSSFLIKKIHPNLSDKRIGQFFNDKNHATILYSRRMVQNRIDTESKFKENIDLLIEIISKEIQTTESIKKTIKENYLTENKKLKAEIIKLNNQIRELQGQLNLKSKKEYYSRIESSNDRAFNGFKQHSL
jgi:hypothetical protein